MLLDREKRSAHAGTQGQGWMDRERGARCQSYVPAAGPPAGEDLETRETTWEADLTARALNRLTADLLTS